jgi:hypothetical protein
MNLYSRRVFGTSLALVLVLAGIFALTTFTAATAQRRKPHKLRATALVELTTSRSGTTTARLVPIAILDDGSFHDASVYKSTPQPMALDGGVVYEAQKTGQTVGYLTLDSARKDVNGNWSASGKWKVASSTAKAQPAIAVPVGSADERPILHREGTSAPNAGGSATPPATSPTPSGSQSSDDRPVLHRSPSEAPPQNTPSPAPAQSEPTPAVAPTPAASPEAAEAPDDPNRPTLRHRTPGSAQQEANAKPAASPAQPAAAPPATSKPAPPAPASAPTGGQTLVAVSDAQTSESRSYEFAWKAGEKEATETKMRRLALTQLFPDNPNALHNDSALAALNNVTIRGFDLDLSNEPVMVLTAELPAGTLTASKPAANSGNKPATKSSSPSAAGNPSPSRATRYVTVIARLDFEGNPQKLAASVTDSSRLDVAPRLELVDAVDVDGDGLGELLFREYSFDDQSFVIYAIGRSTVTKLFEGASQPLKK